MTRPTTYLIRMVLFLAIVGGVVFLLSGPLIIAFQGNPLLNSLILSVLALGIFWNMRQVTLLAPEASWVETYQRARTGIAAVRPPKLLAPMANMLATRDGTRRFTLSASVMRSMLDGIAARVDESRELSRYMTGLLIFLGLLGTFSGAGGLRTVGSISDVIGGMSMTNGGDMNAMFEQLKSGLARPLAGMSTAFSASMFGLAGALVLGFLDLTAGQAQNRFFNELEEWLSSLTRLSSGAIPEGEGSLPAYVQALLEQTAENMESLQATLLRGEQNGAQANQAVLALTERIGALADTLRTNQSLMLRVAETQSTLVTAIQRMAEPRGEAEAARTLRGIESLLQRILTEGEQQGARQTAELRHELRVLTRTVAGAALAAEPPR